MQTGCSRTRGINSENLSFDFSAAVTGGLLFIPELRRLTAVIATNSSIRPRHMERTFSLPQEFRKPTSRLWFTQTGLERIRNPVDLENSSQIDDQITRELLGALEQPPRLKLVSSGVPRFSPLPIGHESDIRS